MSTNKDRQPNRLSRETSPYLLQHAFNPVDWYAWGEEALGRAAAEDKPILLSVGYSACHWCHVMERESFENSEIAAAMNRDYICIKVDREERPDIDAIYMSAVQMLTGQGGWPMTVFLTPRGTPFYGGTYFPPEDHHGRPGFPRVLQAVADAWRTKRKELEDQGEALTGHLSRSESIIAAGGSTLLTPAILESALATISQRYDRVYGGFGPAPKFPQPANLDLLLRLHARFHREAPLEMVETTLQRMALGGIYDQLGGGFHRYSTDAEWLAPHFEKMLYDNAQLAQTCCRAYQITGNPFYCTVAEQTLDYVLREMTDAETGAFYSAQDADSESEEGRFFVWSRQEIVRELGGKDAALFCMVYDVSEGGNWERKNILRVVATAAEAARQHGLSEPEATHALESAREKLMALRDRRVRPGLDDKALTAWNGLMMSAFALCGATFCCDRYLEAAIRNARFIADRMTTAKDGLLRLYRTYRNGEAKLNAYLEDYAFYAEGLLQLYNATGDADWIEAACRVAESITALFDDPVGAGFFSTSADHEELIVRMKDWDDNAVPSGNSVALEVLLKLGAYLDRPEWKDRAAGVLRKLAETLQTHPHGFTRMLAVLDLYLDGPVEAAIRCDRRSADGREMLAALHGSYQPNLVAAFGELEEKAADPPLLRSRPAEGGRATAYICRNSVCSLPITSAAQLKGAL